MDELRERREIPGLSIRTIKQSGTHLLCKIQLTKSDAAELCSRTKSGLFKNKEFHDWFINTIVTNLEEILEEEKANFKKHE